MSRNSAYVCIPGWWGAWGFFFSRQSKWFDSYGRVVMVNNVRTRELRYHGVRQPHPMINKLSGRFRTQRTSWLHIDIYCRDIVTEGSD